MLGIGARHNAECAEMVETETVADPPRDKVVGAGLIAADPDRANLNAARSVKGEPAAKYINAADALADQRIADVP